LPLHSQQDSSDIVKSQERYISPIRGEAPCEQILTKFCTFGDMGDTIICANFGVEKLKGLGNTGIKVWALPLKRLVTLTTVLGYRTACDTVFALCLTLLPRMAE